MKNIYLVRHCSAAGQQPEAALTDKGFQQADALAALLAAASAALKIDRIVSSPFTRAQQSIRPLAAALNLPIEIDGRLAERVLSTQQHDNWRELLQHSFDNMDVCLVGGESGREAMERGSLAIQDILKQPSDNIVVITHGCLMTLILRNLDDSYGFHSWSKLANPDVYVLSFAGKAAATIKHLE